MEIYIECPHCGGMVEITQINCAIFRHGIYKSESILIGQLNPHASELDCLKAVEKDLIYGCGKPFKIIKKDIKYIAIKCDYI